MPFADLSEAKIYYELEGTPTGPVVMLSNSLGADLRMWEPQLPELAPAFRVLRYDTRGHGRSSVPTGPYSIAQLGRDVIELLDYLGERTIHFCGISMGGMLGMYLALHHGDRLQKLVVADTAAKIGSEDVWNPRMETVRQRGMAAVSAATMERWFTAEFRQREPETVARIE